jgi:hypothetical protein
MLKSPGILIIIIDLAPPQLIAGCPTYAKTTAGEAFADLFVDALA